MADRAISELNSAMQILSTDRFVLEQNGTAKQLQGQVLLNWLTAAADGHGGIASIAKIKTSGLIDTYRITLADTTIFDFPVNNGRSISSFVKRSTSGLNVTWRMSYNDGTYTDVVITNGAKGDKGDKATVYIRYASQKPTASSHDMGELPDDWMGIYFGYATTAPTDWNAYSWYQIKGEKGDTGDASIIESTEVGYMASNSGSIIPSGNWQSTVPDVPQGRYLWCRTVIKFNSGSPITSYSVSRMGTDGRGAIVTVNGKTPDFDGDVTISTQDLGAAKTSDVSALENRLNERMLVRKTFSATISTNWTGNAAPYTQTVSIAGVASTDMPHVTLVPSSNNDTAISQLEAYGNISRGVAVSGGIKFTCFEDKPEIALPIQVEIIR